MTEVVHPGDIWLPGPQHESVVAAIDNHYHSVDSAPAQYSVNRAPSVARGCLLAFVGLSAIALCVQMFLVRVSGLIAERDFLVFTAEYGAAPPPMRLFVAIFFVSFALYANGNGWRRLALAASLVGKFVVVCLVIDSAAWLLNHAGVIEVTVLAQQVASALLALMIFPHTLIRQARLPAPARLLVRLGTPWTAYLRFFVFFSLALLLAATIEGRLHATVADLRDWGVLGGVGPGLFLVQQIFVALTGAFGWWLIRRSRRTAFTPPLAVLIPAHNEAHGIAKTIMAVDEAARTYPGQIHAYIVDNASIDGTYQAARGALAACTRISGSVIQCHQPGKAVALNYGLARIEEDFVVRIDADTVIGDRCLATAMRHFANANVGSVGGMPLPAHERTLIDKVRLVEVLMRHGFYQVALFSFDGVLGVPGMFSVYRRRVLMEVGGIAEGMNGEDVDICLRMSQAGYHVVHDPAAQYYSETPDSYSHLREQRVRWFRSLYHIVANNRQVVLDHRSITGTIVLPFMLANSARRAMLAPILVFAMFIAVIFRYNFVDLRWQPLLATVVGIPALMSVLICLLWRRPRALLYLPAYLGFRVLRSYLTLAAILTLVFPPTDSPLRAVHRWWNRDAPPLRRNGIPAGRLSTSR